MANSQPVIKPVPEAVTVYLLPEQQLILEELRLKLRRQGIKVSKSRLVRLALKRLEAKNIGQLIKHLDHDAHI